MNVTSKIAVDLTRANIGARVNAVQGDGNTRYAEITLLAAGDTYAAGSTGGEAEHTLTENEMPRHRHDLQASYPDGATGSEVNGKILAGDDTNQWLYNFAQTGESGWNAPHNNMPPYLAVYMWVRTA